jgi:hypothetical protein
MKCQVVTKFRFSAEGLIVEQKECGRPAEFHDNDCWMCFTCARACRDEGDILSAAGERRFAEIERVVYALPS